MSQAKPGFLSVAYNMQDTGKTVEFHIWDASFGMVRAQVGTLWPTLTDPVVVNPSEKALETSSSRCCPFHVEDFHQHGTLSRWNWVSVNVVDTPLTFSVMNAFHGIPAGDILQVKPTNLHTSIRWRLDPPRF